MASFSLTIWKSCKYLVTRSKGLLSQVDVQGPRRTSKFKKLSHLFKMSNSRKLLFLLYEIHTTVCLILTNRSICLSFSTFSLLLVRCEAISRTIDMPYTNTTATTNSTAPWVSYGYSWNMYCTTQLNDKSQGIRTQVPHNGSANNMLQPKVR